jgi:hydrogenase maturation factor HypE
MVYALYAGQSVSRPGGYVFTAGLEKGVNGTAALAVNTWTHVASTYDGTTLRMFVNGTQVATRAVTGAMPASGDPLRFGGNAIWGEWFTGRLDEIRVYNKARTAAEIQGDMARAVP